MAKFTIKIEAHVVDKDKMLAIKRLEENKQKLIYELKQQTIKHPRYLAAFDLAGYSDFNDNKKLPQLTWVGNGFTAEVSMDAVKEPPKPYVQTVHIEPKTLNALLNGKLLTDEEKRKLLKSVLPADVLNKPLDE